MMSQKRQQDEGNSEGNSPEDKRRKFKSVVLEVMGLQFLQNKLVPVLEPLIRRVVKEELELALTKHVSFKQSCGTLESRSLQLKFWNTLSLPVFTGTRIEGEDGSAIKVALVDALDDEVVDSGPESSAKVEIVVLEGDFDGEEAENWTKEDFQNNIVREREGKKPLLTGDISFDLKDGIGFVGEISFTDNSSWTRSRRFRLGARLVGNSDGVWVREAKTEAFIVRDHRGELYKKHYPPKLSDEVWRLEKIGKDGAFHKRLNQGHVRTVKDFLIMLNLKPAELRNILGSGMSTKMWEVTMDHAQTCVIGKRVYVYYSPNTQQRKGVVFNEVGQLTGTLTENQFVPVDKLSETEKVDANKLIILAYQNLGGVVAFDDENALLGAFTHAPGTHTSEYPRREETNNSMLLASQRVNRPDYMHSSVSTPDIISSFYSIGCMSSSENYGLDPIDAVDVSFDRPLSLPAQVANCVICDTESMTRAFREDEHLRFLDPSFPIQSPNPMLESQADLHSIVSGFLRPRIAQRRWRLIFSVLQWFFVMRIVRRTNVEDIPR
ncbi:hypothetical protein Ancab_039014 [Ancistrocladus abbreviatus]